ncbi:mechanosensitive ion channel protein MscS [Mesotoga sp. Brook.08.YT.4.2.5.1]|uniref:mechanosensitive ion channel family protein n=1 Tax=unclassified Mesotoga TaxID=1184398 RepID=UPI000C9B71D9|nr:MULTISPECIES: mechanosensitive ion channel domain-containing protein [unclassified Mesotoga]PNE23575.1 mechanosensitive ion channel protein MscS [Mesotoga sp. Brook.08.YT.4.2.5.1]RAO95586.1 mechanosensitive ion channel protein MscS [Mesotoga sp. Brook.08.YT.4.2.5.4.]RDI90783.1 mechanosensitive ion channel protein MscS [Mesotoga sp. Brook.08.YT.4.2.5.2.]
MVNIFAGWFSALGLSETFDLVLANIVVGIIMIVVAFLSKYIFEKVLIKPIELIVRKSAFKWDDLLVKHKLLNKIALMIPAIVIALFAPAFPAISDVIYRLVTTYLIFIAAVVIDAFLDVFTSAYQSLETSKDKPIKSYMTVVKLMVYIIAGVVAVSVLTGISPWGILSGIGAMTAVLLVIFRDSLLGLVASIQISKNNLVSIGDWIEVPRYQADGDVIDITLTTIRIQNWDKTITTIPSYAIISESFKNWKGMFQAGGRRIKRSVYIDTSSVRFLDDDLYDRLYKIQILRPYLESRKKEIEEFNRMNEVDVTEPVNGRRMTNIGTFRAYLTAYLRNHPGTNKDLIMMVRQLQPTDTGLPLEIYAFSKDTSWVNYESLQSDIFDHIFATLPHFDLRVFQNPSGNDLRAMGDLLVGKRQGHEQDNSEELFTESPQLHAEKDT